MDRLIYIAMNGAKATLERQAATANNMANVSTTGYKGQVNAFRALPVAGEGAKTRVFTVETTVGADWKEGPIMQTGRKLDVAVNGKGWITVLGPDLRLGYTRAGDLQVSANGLLQTRTGLNVMGQGGPITVPPNSTVTIGEDGTVSTIPTDTHTEHREHRRSDHAGESAGAGSGAQRRWVVPPAQRRPGACRTRT